MLFNLAVGGNKGFPFSGTDNRPENVTALPTAGSSAKMYIDYVKVYQKGDANQSYNGPAPGPICGDPTVDVTCVTLNKNTTTLAVNATEQLTATVQPTNATNKVVTWSSNNTAVATVVNGLITAKTAGTATITVTTADGGKTATCAVTVDGSLPPMCTNVALGKPVTASSAEVGANPPTPATNVTVAGIATRWASKTENDQYTPEWVRIDLQNVYDISEIKINWEGAFARSYNIETSVNGVDGWQTYYTTTTGNGGINTIAGAATAQYVRINCTQKGFNWNGTYYGYSIYEVEVCGVPHVAGPIAVTGVTLNKNTATLTAGATEQLTATVLPTNATNQAVTWSSNNTAVATVVDGLVTAKTVGTATITVTTADGNKTATCVVTVNAAPELPGSEICPRLIGTAEINNDTPYAYLSYETNDERQMIITIYPYNLATEIGANYTKFRNEGYNADRRQTIVVGNMGANTGNRYFTMEVSADATQLIFTPVVDIPYGTEILFPGGGANRLNWQTPGGVNGWSDEAFTYTYGSKCVFDVYAVQPDVTEGTSQICWEVDENLIPLIERFEIHTNREAIRNGGNPKDFTELDRILNPAIKAYGGNVFCYHIEDKYLVELKAITAGAVMADVKIITVIGGVGYESEVVYGLQMTPTGISIPFVAKEVVKTQYFTIDGRQVAVPTSGIHLVRKTFNDGSVITEKVIVK